MFVNIFLFPYSPGLTNNNEECDITDMSFFTFNMFRGIEWLYTFGSATTVLMVNSKVIFNNLMNIC